MWNWGVPKSIPTYPINLNSIDVTSSTHSFFTPHKGRPINNSPRTKGGRPHSSNKLSSSQAYGNTRHTISGRTSSRGWGGGNTGSGPSYAVSKRFRFPLFEVGQRNPEFHLTTWPLFQQKGVQIFLRPQRKITPWVGEGLLFEDAWFGEQGWGCEGVLDLHAQL